MDFHKMPSSAILYLYFGSLFAPDRQTDGRTACQFLGSLCFDNHPFGVDNNNNNNWFLRPLRRRNDVIGDLSRSGTNNGELLEPKREKREKVLGQRRSDFSTSLREFCKGTVSYPRMTLKA